MDAPRTHKEKVAIAFMIVWMVFWTAGIIVGVYVLGGAVFAGEPMAALVLLAWLGGAGFGLLSAGRRLRALLLREPARKARRASLVRRLFGPAGPVRPAGRCSPS